MPKGKRKGNDKPQPAKKRVKPTQVATVDEIDPDADLMVPEEEELESVDHQVDDVVELDDEDEDVVMQPAEEQPAPEEQEEEPDIGHAAVFFDDILRVASAQTSSSPRIQLRLGSLARLQACLEHVHSTDIIEAWRTSSDSFPLDPFYRGKQ